MATSRRTKATTFSNETKMKIVERDQGCIFCKHGLYPNEKDIWDKNIMDIAHIINKSQGGLGIEQNGVQSCRYHHHLLDNGNQGLREMLLSFAKEYLKRKYPDWNDEDLIYKKGEEYVK